MVAVLLLAALQGPTWVASPPGATVGDTLVLERLLPATAGVRARTRALEAADVLEPLMPPDVTPVAAGLRIRHVVALFAPGIHAVSMPPIELLHPDGTVEVVLGDTAFVRIGAVIPDSVTIPVPMPSQAPLARPMRRPARAAAPVLATMALLTAWVLWRRRTGRELLPAVEPAGMGELPLMRWLAAGERRAVATVAVHRLRAAVAAEVPGAAQAADAAAWAAAVADARPTWPVSELVDVLRALERARFAPLGGDDLAELVDRADVVIGRLASAETAGP